MNKLKKVLPDFFYFCRVIESCAPQIDTSKANVSLSYSRYWYFSRYPHLYTPKKIEDSKKIFFERLIEEYTLNQWQFQYLEWTIDKMNKLSPMVNPTSFILNSDPANDYLVHLTECFNLF